MQVFKQKIEYPEGFHGLWQRKIDAFWESSFGLGLGFKAGTLQTLFPQILAAQQKTSCSVISVCNSITKVVTLVSCWSFSHFRLDAKPKHWWLIQTLGFEPELIPKFRSVNLQDFGFYLSPVKIFFAGLHHLAK